MVEEVEEEGRLSGARLRLRSMCAEKEGMKREAGMPGRGRGREASVVGGAGHKSVVLMGSGRSGGACGVERLGLGEI